MLLFKQPGITDTQTVYTRHSRQEVAHQTPEKHGPFLCKSHVWKATTSNGTQAERIACKGKHVNDSMQACPYLVWELAYRAGDFCHQHPDLGLQDSPQCVPLPGQALALLCQRCSL